MSDSITVYKAINAVQAELAQQGISKSRENKEQRFKFRGIDEVYNALSPLLAKHGLCILPRMLSRTVQERATKSGGVMFSVAVEAEFDFVSAEDGSRHTIRTYGEAMDSGDKATNKAMSAAYKYAALMAFAIPTEGDNDADAHSHEIEPQMQRAAAPQRGASAPQTGATDHWPQESSGPSQKQRDFIKSLMRELDWNNDSLIAFALTLSINTQAMSKDDASKLIEAMKATVGGVRA